MQVPVELQQVEARHGRGADVRPASVLVARLRDARPRGRPGTRAASPRPRRARGGRPRRRGAGSTWRRGRPRPRACPAPAPGGSARRQSRCWAIMPPVSTTSAQSRAASSSVSTLQSTRRSSHSGGRSAATVHMPERRRRVAGVHDPARLAVVPEGRLQELRVDEERAGHAGTPGATAGGSAGADSARSANEDTRSWPSRTWSCRCV